MLEKVLKCQLNVKYQVRKKNLTQAITSALMADTTYKMHISKLSVNSQECTVPWACQLKIWSGAISQQWVGHHQRHQLPSGIGRGSDLVWSANPHQQVPFKFENSVLAPCIMNMTYLETAARRCSSSLGIGNEDGPTNNVNKSLSLLTDSLSSLRSFSFWVAIWIFHGESISNQSVKRNTQNYSHHIFLWSSRRRLSHPSTPGLELSSRSSRRVQGPTWQSSTRGSPLLHRAVYQG